MDEFLDDAWQSGEPPFHGATVRNEESLTLRQLQAALVIVADSLEQHYGRAQKLLLLDDWHEHDGFHLTGKRIELPALRTMLADETRLAKTRVDDFNVYRAIYPAAAEWLLRWYIGDETPAECEFTFSASDDEAREVADLLRATVAITVDRSAKYFRDTYRG